MNSLLIELGTEELPVKALSELAQAFAAGIAQGLNKRGVAHGSASTLYTPRRLAVLIDAVADTQPPQHSEVLGPYLNIALDTNGQPTKALQGFASKAGVDWTQLEKTTDNKGERFVFRNVSSGAATVSLIQSILDETLKAMPIPKPMRWGARETGFARPVHWLVALYGDHVIDCEAFGHRAGRQSRGHRFMHPDEVAIATADSYIQTLQNANVIVDAQARREKVRTEVETAAKQAGGSARITEDNLEQVQCLVEWPKAVLCSFEREFLRVPQEALISTMEANQKFFPVLDQQGQLTERFIGIANIISSDESKIREGYERVIRPRFADAAFFFDEDLKQGLSAMNRGLETVTYHAKLGSYADKVDRIQILACQIASKMGIDVELTKRAARLCKADLQSRMVNEFPELQGIAGRYYAQHDSALNDLAKADRAAVAKALDEVYQPRFAGDAIAMSKLGQVLAVAERADTLAGGFQVGLQPTGNKDPFALRRNALGLARTLLEGGIDIDIVYLIHETLDKVRFTETRVKGDERTAKAQEAKKAGVQVPEVVPGPIGTGPSKEQLIEVIDFVIDRLQSYYADQDISPQSFNAVRMAITPYLDPGKGWKKISLLDFDARLKAIHQFTHLAEAQPLAAANKRIRNILRKADENIPDEINTGLLTDATEKTLHSQLLSAIKDTEQPLQQRDYVTVLKRLAQLREPIDAFFDNVMVMAEDPALRLNRLALLKKLADQFSAVAAIEHLSTV